MTADTLREIIAASGLSDRRFAREVVGRDERTVRRWLTGDPIPQSAAQWLARIRIRVSCGAVTIRVLHGT